MKIYRLIYRFIYGVIPVYSVIYRFIYGVTGGPCESAIPVIVPFIVPAPREESIKRP